MSAELIDGKAIAATVNEETAMEVAALARNHNLQPGLVVVLIGEDPASQVYVNMKVRKCAELGIFSDRRALPKDTPQEEVIELVRSLNENPAIHGILVQSPPPPQIDESAVVDAINPDKDVDCFHPVNVGRMLLGEMDGFLPCTPYGVMTLLERSGVDPSGRHAVVIGRSNIVGKPLATMLMQKSSGANATVTVCHSRTADLADHARRADILIACMGKPEFVTADMVKEGAVVIDVGVNRVEAPDTKKGYRLAGDVAFEEVVKKASKITPVPGGVGPMTIAMLMRNTVKAAKRTLR